MPGKNAFYAQSGGVTAVINATACGVIETARKHRAQIANVYAGRHGIIGALRGAKMRQVLEFAWMTGELVRNIRECDRPVIAAINGFALGGVEAQALAPAQLALGTRVSRHLDISCVSLRRGAFWVDDSRCAGPG